MPLPIWKKGRSTGSLPARTDHPSLTPRQIETLRALREIQMRYIAFWVIIILFTAVLIAFLAECFYFQTGLITKGSLIGGDTVLGWAFKRIYTSLFHVPSSGTSANSN